MPAIGLRANPFFPAASMRPQRVPARTIRHTTRCWQKTYARGNGMDPKRYRQLVRERLPKPDLARGVTRAFVLGGTIALLGQVVYDIFRAMEPTQGEAVAATLATLILIGGVLTALGVYDNLAEWGGAGAAVPITGFANTIVSAAMDFRR